MSVHSTPAGTVWPNDAGRLPEGRVPVRDERSGIIRMSQPFLPLSGFHPIDANNTEAARNRKDRARNGSFHEPRERRQ